MLTIIKSTNGNVFGGFTTKPWSINSVYENDPDAFIFSLINSKKTPLKFDCKVPQYAIRCHSSYGPVFGHDFEFLDLKFYDLNFQK